MEGLPHLAALFLPEDGRLRVASGLALEDSHPACRHHLVPRTDGESWRNCRGKGKIYYMYIHLITQLHDICHQNGMIFFFGGDFAITFEFRREDKTHITYSMDGRNNSAREENNCGLMSSCSCLTMDEEWTDDNLPVFTKRKRKRHTGEQCNE